MIENQYLISVIPGADQHPLELRHVVEELLDLRLGGEAHHPLDAGAVVPGAVEQHDLAARRQVRHVALEVPLGALAVGRRRQRHDAGDARVEPLGDALDRAALAGAVAALEQHDDLRAGVLHPALQLDQLGLQPQQLAQVDAAGPSRAAARLGRAGGSPCDSAGSDEFELEILVEHVVEFGLEPVGGAVEVVRRRHARSPDRAPAP